MQPFIDTLKHFARPTSVLFVVTALSVGVLLLFMRRTQRYARWYFVALLAMFWLGSAPAVIERVMIWKGGDYRPIANAADARGASVVVVLGGGNQTIQARGGALNQVSWTAALRLLEAARLYRLLDHPTVIVSGGITAREPGARSEGDAMRTAIVELGVPPDKVLIEAVSKTTHDEAREIARMLAGRPKEPIVIVTSPTHLPRAIAVFRAAGLDPVPSASPYASDHSLDTSRWAPSDVGLILFDTLVYDTMSGVYYWLRGWG